jgi:hypothetical protein
MKKWLTRIDRAQQNTRSWRSGLRRSRSTGTIGRRASLLFLALVTILGYALPDSRRAGVLRVR